jgi:hypothetical protein
MRHNRLTRSTAPGLALAASSAVAQPDLRSPDTRDTALASTEANARHDLRSPDTRDGAEARDTFSAPEVTVVNLHQPSPSAAGGIDCGDAGIGAGTLLDVILLGLGSTLAVLNRRHGAPARRETATTG